MQTIDAGSDQRLLFRKLVGRFATGVTVVAMLRDGFPQAITVNSLTSVSLDPLILLFCIRSSSSILPLLAEPNRFTVNVLAGYQEDACRRYAGQRSGQASGHEWEVLGESPVLKGALATFVCSVRAITPCGDHHVVFADVLEMREPTTLDSALVFLGGQFQSISLESGAQRGDGLSFTAAPSRPHSPATRAA